ncbi:nicotinamide-nucleotide amidohydrolase family protein [Ancylobacter sp. WKF20]|uniref:CinA family protein n=1 Tax=Ancylobacter sp. WKF20 TaxID=3039801 RepID=UPI00325FDDB8
MTDQHHADAIALEAIRVLDLCRARRLTVATAESCTGGLVAGALTEIAGSSDVVDRGLVTYSNTAKEQMLGVSPATLDAHGAVSAQTAREMVTGLLRVAGTSLGVSITGIAGPGGGSAQKPVGLVYFAAASAGGRRIERREVFAGQDRAGVRRLSVLTALAMLAELAAQEPVTP